MVTSMTMTTGYVVVIAICFERDLFFLCPKAKKRIKQNQDTNQKKREYHKPKLTDLGKITNITMGGTSESPEGKGEGNVFKLPMP